MKFSIFRVVRFAVIFAATPAALATAALATTWYVNGVSGRNSNNCLSPTTACKTIGHAISLASSGNSIIVAPGTYKENLTIRISLNVIGSGASTTIIDGGSAATVVTIPNTGTSVILSRMTIRNGYAPFEGAGIYNAGTLTIDNSTVSGNLAHGVCSVFLPECFGGSGGGIYNTGMLTINNSTISGNVATVPSVQDCRAHRVSCRAGYGGGIYNRGTLTTNNSTVGGNTVFGRGGGIGNFSILTISNSTISGNSGGIWSDLPLDTVKIQNSIVANNNGGNCSVGITSKGYNLSSDGTCNFNGPGDMNNTTARVGKLGYYGGSTPTIPLLMGSPAIDAGNPSGCTDGSGHLLKSDQRGMPRPDTEDKTGCDMGAYERQSD